jgi:sec-independent protein translocase protein TatC
MTSRVAPHWVGFLVELRKRVLRSLLCLSVIFLVLLYFANDLYTLLALPLLKHLPHGQGLIATNIVASFFVPVELTFVLSLFLSVPYFLYQFWVFIAPALYAHERHLLWPLLLISTLLFYVGIAFAYFVILPLLFAFLTKSAPTGVFMMPDISLYLDFTLKLFVTFGAIFEVPIVTIVVIWTGITTREALIKARPYVIVGAFIVGMLLSPPDVLSQILLAVPLCLLFELGLLLSPFFSPHLLEHKKNK